MTERKVLSEPKQMPRLKWLVVATSVFPFKSIYTTLYKVISWWVARQLYKDPNVGAVYIRNGCARGEVVPGISDIDVTILLRDGVELPPDGHLDIRKLWADFGQRHLALAHRLPLLDKNALIVPAARLPEYALTFYQLRYLLMEMKTNSGLVCGRDYIAERVPPLPEPIRQGALVARIEMRWLLFSVNFIVAPSPSLDRLARNSICYRFCCDIIRMILDFSSGEQTYKRAGVLRRSLGLLAGEDRSFAARLIDLEARRFMPQAKDIIEETQGFLLRQYNSFYAKLAEHTVAQPIKKVEHHIDCPPEETTTLGSNEPLVKRLLTHIEDHWQEKLRGAYLVPSCFFEIDDQLLLLQVEPENLPSVSQLAQLHHLHRQLQDSNPRQVRLFLLLPNMACCLDPAIYWPKDWHNMLPQLFVADLFALLQRQNHVLRPGEYQVWGQPALTVYSACFFWSQRLRYRQHIEAWQPGFNGGLLFLRQWWKWLQLEVIHRGIEAGRIRYPLTLPAIVRGLSAVGLEPPPCADQLALAYRNAMRGSAVDTSSYMGQAQAYVQRADPEGHRFNGPPPWLV